MIYLTPIALDLVYNKEPWVTWTPGYTTTGSYSVTVSTVEAKYRRFGKWVDILWKGVSTSTPSGAGGVQISLPFTLDSSHICGGWNGEGTFGVSAQSAGAAILIHNRDNTTPFTANAQNIGLLVRSRIA